MLRENKTQKPLRATNNYRLGISTQRHDGISEEAIKRLDAITLRIQEKPGNLIKPGELDATDQELNVRGVMQNLPPGMAESDFLGILKLAMLTECNTDVFAEKIQGIAKKDNAPWLSSFNEVWKMDESTHMSPYYQMLRSAGYSEAELDLMIKETRERAFENKSVETPFDVSGYGVFSEFSTELFHGGAARIMRPRAPKAARAANRVKGRETQHREWYGEYVSTMVEDNPFLIRRVARTMDLFEMPGKSIAPEYQERAGEWMDQMEYDFDLAARSLTKIVHKAAGSPSAMGELFLELASRKGEKLGPVTVKQLMAVSDRLGGIANGVVGEAILHKFGLDYLFTKPEGHKTPIDRLAGNLRKRLREGISNRLPLDLKTRTVLGNAHT